MVSPLEVLGLKPLRVNHVTANGDFNLLDVLVNVFVSDSTSECPVKRKKKKIWRTIDVLNKNLTSKLTQVNTARVTFLNWWPQRAKQRPGTILFILASEQ